MRHFFNVFFLAITIAGYGQNYVVTGENLVPNPNFENTRACPKDADYIGGVVAWNLFPNFSSDYFHRCANQYQQPEYLMTHPYEEIQNFSVPRNIFGYQEAHSGDAYAGLSFCYEALSVKLREPLKKDSLYRVEFFVSLADSSNVGTRCFGMYFSETSLRVIAGTQISGFILDEPPQIQNTPDYYLIDTANWTPISGIYKAKGGEQYISIGGFYQYHDSLVQFLRPERALKKVYRGSEKQLGYYFVDDVSVIPYSERWEPRIGKSYVLEYVYFDFDKSNLLPVSYHELDKLVNFMKLHPTLHVSITGHTDNFGGETYNLNLSDSRAKSVANYLTANGIEKKRIIHNGAGSAYPIADNDTKEGRDRNRRVEFILNELEE
ncbi:MAG: OmpA family protein [Bacteroidales bacterium]|jgi:outer membrane protein OmpA-like peptidoglycan-associated protein|nr:OmpA family protein [Bacteroidales bacterium]